MDAESTASPLKYRRILRAVYSTPWAIVPSRLADIREVLAFRGAGNEIPEAEMLEHIGVKGAPPARSRTAGSGGAVAVLRLSGIIGHRIEQVENVSGPPGTAVERFRARFREALANSNVGALVIDVDSPGGSVDGVPELASEIFAARGGDKPIVAVANTLAASAAYWIASAADEMSVTPSGEVGSIGVFAAHEDVSKLLEREGRQVTLISAGRFKVEGNPFEPLTEEARDNIQMRVDAVYGEFLDAVAAGRGVTAKTVRSDFGEGRVVSAQDALAAGMVDRVETLEQAISRVSGAATQRRRAAQAPRSAAAWEFS